MNFESFSPGLVLAAVVGIALVPYLAVMVTAFTKLVVVFSLLRSALGLQQTPPNVVLNGLAIILSIYVMYPVGLQMAERARSRIDASPPQTSPPPASPAAGRFTGLVESTTRVADRPPAEPSTGADLARLIDIADHAKEPLRDFLVRHSSDAEREFFLASAQRMLPEAQKEKVAKDDLVVIVPAFTSTELGRAFQIGFLIFLPFLVIDLIIANVLQALGMMMLSPTTISLPFKLLLFVALDGWSKLMHGLVASY